MGWVVGFVAAYGAQILTVVSLAATIALSFVGNKGPGVEGPRLGDKKIQTSTYGDAIPIGFGRIRLAGNVVWATDIVEVKTTKEVGGKMGGTTQDVTTYSYFGQFAVMFSEGPAVAHSRVWADKKLIYDLSGDSPTYRKYPTSPLRAYLGDDTQLPDPMIEADLGVGATPAFRGRVYIAFELLPLIDFGNRLPQIESEIQFAVPTGTATIDLTEMNSWGVDHLREDVSTGQLYGLHRSDVVGTALVHSVFRYDTLTDSVEVETSAYIGADKFGIGSSGFAPRHGVMPGPDGRLFVLGVNVSNGFNYMVELNSWTLEVIGAWDIATLVSQANIDDAAMDTMVVQLAAGTETFSVFSMNGDGGGGADQDTNYFVLLNRRALLSETSNGWSTFLTEFDRGVRITDWITHDDKGNFWACGWFEGENDQGANDNESAYLWKLSPVSDADHTDGPLYVAHMQEFNLIKLTNSNEWWSPEDSLIGHPRCMVFDEITNTLTIWTGPKQTGSNYRVIQFDLDTEEVINQVEHSDATLYPRVLTGTNNDFPVQEHLKEGCNEFSETYFYPLSGGDTNGWVKYNARTFSFSFVTGPSIDGTISGTYWYRDADAFFQWNGPVGENGGGVDPVRFNRLVINSSPDTLDDVLTQLCNEVGLESAQMNMDATIAATNVDGYVVTRAGSARDAIGPLAFAYIFDAMESDSKIQFVSRAGSSVRTLTEDDLGYVSGEVGAEDRVMVTRLQEVECPERIDVRYMDFNRDYQEGNQSAQRMEFPNATQYSRSTVNQDLPMVLLPDTAKVAAEAQLYNAWISRLTHDFSLGPKHLDLDPTDIVTLQQEGKPDQLLRLVELDVGDAFVTKAKSGVHDPEVYNVLSTGVDVATASQIIVAPGPAQMFLLDIPLLEDAQSTGPNTGLYTAMSGLRSTWTSGYIQKAETNAGPFALFETSLGVHNWGYLTADLPALTPRIINSDWISSWNRGLNRIDHIASFSVDMVIGAANLASVSPEDLLKGDNTLVIQDMLDPTQFEIIMFENVSVSGDTVTLTGLARGLRGTENAAHTGFNVGSRVVFLDRELTGRKEIPVAEVDETFVYRPASAGAAYDQTYVYGHIHQGADLMPYGAAHTNATPRVSVGRSASTVTMTWQRRSRLGGEDGLRDGLEENSVGEVSERYEVDLIDKGLETVSVTKSGLTTETTSFTTTERTTAGYTTSEAIRVKIYQLSDVPEIGRGFVGDFMV